MPDLARRTVLALFTAGVATSASPVFADHPGEDLDAVMFDKEKYFEIVDEPQAPGFALQDADGDLVNLSDFAEKVVVLNFVYANCPDVCPLHAEKIASIQEKIAVTPMKDMVQFVSITTDPKSDTPEVLSEYPEIHGLDAANWMFLTRHADQPEDATRTLAKRYGLEFTLSGDSDMQIHGAVTHVIDRGGRFAAKFHGLDFKDVNLVLYVNGLINNAQHRERGRKDRSWLDSVRALFK